MSLLEVDIITNETLASYLDRIWELNGLLGTKRSFIEKQHPDVWNALMARLAETIDDNCQTCIQTWEQKWACRDCTGGALIPLKAHFADWVCIKHKRWLPMNADDDGRYATAEEFAGQTRLSRLRGQGLTSCTWWLSRSIDRSFGLDLNLNDLLDLAEQLSNGQTHLENMPAEVSALLTRLLSGVANGTHVGAGISRLAAPKPQNGIMWDQGANGARSGSVPPNKMVSWVCAAGHVFTASVFNIETLGVGCPECANPRPTTNPAPRLGALGFELDTRLVDPEERGLASKTFKAPWICPWGHLYEATTSTRRKGRGCNVCAGRSVLRGFNDLLTISPQLAMEWDCHANGTDAAHILAGHKSEQGWTCPSGHRYQASPSGRRSKKTHCPVCSGREVVPGVNDLASLRPVLTQQLVDPSMGRTVMPSSRTVLTWRCLLGHVYPLRVADRAGRDIGCPKCSGRTK